MITGSGWYTSLVALGWSAEIEKVTRNSTKSDVKQFLGHEFKDDMLMELLPKKIAGVFFKSKLRQIWN